MQLVIQGLRITVNCRYIKFTQSKYLNIYIDEGTSCFHIEFPNGFLSTDLVDARIEILNPTKLQSTDYIKITNPKIDLNGCVITKLIQTPYTISQIIVSDLTEFVMDYDENHCDILIPEPIRFRTDKYIQLINRNPYLKVIDYKRLSDLRNFYSIHITDKDVKLVSENDFKFNTKSKYTKYLLEMIDVQNSFITSLNKLVTDYGMHLFSEKYDDYSQVLHNIIYRFTDLDKQINYKSDSNPLRWVSYHTAHIDFTLETPDMVLYTDFKNKYQNLDLISNFTEFYTTDKLGRNWKSSVFWSAISTDFNHDYAQNNEGNISFTAQFFADINYCIVFDAQYYNISKVILDIQAKDDNKLIKL